MPLEYIAGFRIMGITTSTAIWSRTIQQARREQKKRHQLELSRLLDRQWLDFIVSSIHQFVMEF